MVQIKDSNMNEISLLHTELKKKFLIVDDKFDEMNNYVADTLRLRKGYREPIFSDEYDKDNIHYIRLIIKHLVIDPEKKLVQKVQNLLSNNIEICPLVVILINKIGRQDDEKEYYIYKNKFKFISSDGESMLLQEIIEEDSSLLEEGEVSEIIEEEKISEIEEFEEFEEFDETEVLVERAVENERQPKRKCQRSRKLFSVNSSNYFFRSRLEASFATFLNELNLNYSYESLTFNFHQKKNHDDCQETYTLDFSIQMKSIYSNTVASNILIELKPQFPHIQEWNKTQHVSELGFQVILMYGDKFDLPIQLENQKRHYNHSKCFRGITWNGICDSEGFAEPLSGFSIFCELKNIETMTEREKDCVLGYTQTDHDTYIALIQVKNTSEMMNDHFDWDSDCIKRAFNIAENVQIFES
jgi:hypothetical protein